MLRRLHPQRTDYCYCFPKHKCKNRLPKRLCFTLQSLTIMVIIAIRSISEYSLIVGAFHTHRNTAVTTKALVSPTVATTFLSSSTNLRHSSISIQRSSVLCPLQRRWRLYWKPISNAEAESCRINEHRQNIMPSSLLNTATTITSRSITTSTAKNPPTQLEAHSNIRDADIVEMLVGGERYSLVPMPSAMKAITVFVGNLCEFVQDSDLSAHFSQVSSLTSVPSCVVRKVNTQSMGYGFVSFPNVQEKEVIFWG